MRPFARGWPRRRAHPRSAPLAVPLFCLALAWGAKQGDTAPAGRGVDVDLVQLEETTAPGPEVGLGFQKTLNEIKSSAWSKYGEMVIGQHAKNAKESRDELQKGHTSETLSRIPNEIKSPEETTMDERKLQHTIDNMQEKIYNDAGTLHDGAIEVQSGAEQAEQQASRLLEPGAYEQVARDAAIAKEIEQNERSMDHSKGRGSSVLDDASPNAHSTESIKTLEMMAEKAAEEQSKYVADSEKEAASLGKLVAETNSKLSDAVQQRISKLEKDVASRNIKLEKLNQLEEKSKAHLVRTEANAKKASAAATKGKEHALQILEADSLRKKLLPSQIEQAASKAVNKAKSDMNKAQEAIEHAEDEDAEEEEDDGPHDKPTKQDEAIHKAQMHMLEAKAKLVKAEGVQKREEHKDSPEEEKSAYDRKVKQFEKTKHSAEKDVKAAKSIVDTTQQRIQAEKKHVASEEKRLAELNALSKQLHPISASSNASNATIVPLSKETEELSSAEAIVESAKKAAKQVRAKATEQLRDEVGRLTAENLLLTNKLEKAQHDVVQEETIVKAQDTKLNAQPESEKDIVAKAKVEAEGAKKMMEEAKAENEQVVDREKKAALSVIAAMKAEIKHQLAEARKQETERDAEAKQMLGKATSMLLQAKSLVGDFKERRDEEAAKKKAVYDEPKELAKISFDKLKALASREVQQIGQEISSTQDGELDSPKS